MKTYQEILIDLAHCTIQGLEILLEDDLTREEYLEIGFDKELLKDIVNDDLLGTYEINKILDLAKKYKRVE